jgi:hypothetical protein
MENYPDAGHHRRAALAAAILAASLGDPDPYRGLDAPRRVGPSSTDQDRARKKRERQARKRGRRGRR